MSNTCEPNFSVTFLLTLNWRTCEVVCSWRSEAPAAALKGLLTMTAPPVGEFSVRFSSLSLRCDPASGGARYNSVSAREVASGPAGFAPEVNCWWKRCTHASYQAEITPKSGRPSPASAIVHVRVTRPINSFASASIILLCSFLQSLRNSLYLMTGDFWSFLTMAWNIIIKIKYLAAIYFNITYIFCIRNCSQKIAQFLIDPAGNCSATITAIEFYENKSHISFCIQMRK